MTRVLVTISSGDEDDLQHGVRERHLRMLVAQGLTPVLVPGTVPLAPLAEGCAAAYLPGTDYVPSRLGESEEASRAGAAEAGLPWDRWKVAADLAVIELAWERGLPLLGVCGGMQAMAIHAGGALRAGTEAEVGAHADRKGTEPAEVAPGTLAARVLAGGAEPNSFHRQVVEDPGSLTVSVRAADGVIEAVEAPGHPFWLGVQWHPELLGDERPFAALADATR